MLIILKHRLSEIVWLVACDLNATLAAKYQVLIYFHAGFRYYLNFAQTCRIVSLVKIDEKKRSLPDRNNKNFLIYFDARFR